MLTSLETKTLYPFFFILISMSFLLGSGTELSKLMGAFPVGFLGGAGYGSGLRFGFEKVFDSLFKNIDISRIGEVIEVMQGGFGIGANFSGGISDSPTTTGESIPETISASNPNSPFVGSPVTPTTTGATIPETIPEPIGPPQITPTGGLQPVSNPIYNLSYQYNLFDSAGQLLSTPTVSWRGTEDQLKNEIRIKDSAIQNDHGDSTSGQLRTALSKLLGMRNAFHDKFGYWA